MHIITTKEGRDGVKETRRYWPVPPVVEGEYNYEDVNKDPKLRENVTKFFYNKVLKWIEKDPKYMNLKSIKTLLEKHGKRYIYNILRRFVKKSKLNWYNLKDEYKFIKKYMYNKLLAIK